MQWNSSEESSKQWTRVMSFSTKKASSTVISAFCVRTLSSIVSQRALFPIYQNAKRAVRK